MKEKILIIIISFMFIVSCASTKLPTDPNLPTHKIDINAEIDVPEDGAKPTSLEKTVKQQSETIAPITVEEAFEILSNESDFKIVTEQPMQEKLTIRMNQVQWDRVFFAILHVRKLDYRIENDTIYVFKK